MVKKMAWMGMGWKETGVGIGWKSLHHGEDVGRWLPIKEVARRFSSRERGKAHLHTLICLGFSFVLVFIYVDVGKECTVRVMGGEDDGQTPLLY